MVGTTALGMLAVAASTARVVSALDPDICATFNTAKMERFTDKLQSNGLCHDHCLVYYAFSITKGYDCWCSNVAPSESATVDLPNCNSACPGYPGEPCGGANGAFSYVRLRNIDRSSQPPKSTSQAESTQGDEPEPTSESSSPMSKSVTESESEPLITKSVTSEPTEPISTGIHTVAADRATKTVFVGPTDLPKNGDGYRGDGEIIGNDHNGNAGDGAVSKTLLLVLSSGGQANQRFQQTTSHGRHAHLAKPCGFSGQRKQGGQAAPGMEMKGFVCGRPEEYHQETLLANEIGVKN